MQYKYSKKNHTLLPQKSTISQKKPNKTATKKSQPKPTCHGLGLVLPN